MSARTLTCDMCGAQIPWPTPAYRVQDGRSKLTLCAVHALERHGIVWGAPELCEACERHVVRPAKACDEHVVCDRECGKTARDRRRKRGIDHPLRKCANPACDSVFEQRTATQQACSATCRQALRRRRSEDADRVPYRAINGELRHLTVLAHPDGHSWLVSRSDADLRDVLPICFVQAGENPIDFARDFLTGERLAVYGQSLGLSLTHDQAAGVLARNAGDTAASELSLQRLVHARRQQFRRRPNVLRPGERRIPVSELPNWRPNREQKVARLAFMYGLSQDQARKLLERQKQADPADVGLQNLLDVLTTRAARAKRAPLGRREAARAERTTRQAARSTTTPQGGDLRVAA